MQEVDLTELRGIGASTAQLFASVGVHSLWDLVHYYPRDYKDYSEITPISKTKPGLVTIQADIKQAAGRYVRRGMHITEAVASDKTGSIRLVWFNQPYRADSLKPSQAYFITGKLEFRSGRYAIVSPNTELVSDLPVHTARIVPVYRETKGLTARLIRKAMSQTASYLKNIDELLPETIVKKYKLLPYGQALHQLHFPDSPKKLDEAKRTLSFIEIFELMLASKILKAEVTSELAPQISFDETLAKKFVASLPFTLTDAQRGAMWQILQDMDRTTPTNRLVEGDVGSGKTVVAAMAMVMAVKAGYQAALLAPTELLARQHAESIIELLKPLKKDKGVGLLVGSLKKAQKEQAHKHLADGKIQVAVGTHALLQGIDMPKLGLVVIDEQHRFGVEQRKELLKQYGQVPHVVSMTATPIPRSLALTLYGELDISLLDAMPPGRKTIKTEIISPNSRTKMEEHILSETNAGHQAYVVCPVISKDNKIQTVSAEVTYKRLKSVFKEKTVGLIHGKLKPDEKISVMEDFVSGRIDILVSTTVIEVGVNVPNATIMVIEGADRFGLAQMHQLRGRVGRSTDQAYCYVVPSDSKTVSRRLKAFSQVTDGFRLAELDLEIRGPGAIYGTLQHGELDLRFATLSDHRLLSYVRQAVNDFNEVKQLSKYPELKRRVRLAQAVITLN